MAESFQEKTEEPTARVLEDARAKGNVPQSQDLTAATVMVGGALFLMAFGASMFQSMQGLIRDAANLFPVFAQTDLSVVQLVKDEAPRLLGLLAPFLAMIYLVTFGIAVFQAGGFQISSKAIGIKPEKLNPVAGMQKLWSLRSVVRTGAALARLIVIATSVALVMWINRDDLTELALLDLNSSIGVVTGVLMELFLTVAVILLILGAIDWMYQKWQWRKDLRMTKQEVKDENKSHEGDPLIKNKIRAQQRAVFERSLSASVKEATLVITNPTHFAVALKYDDATAAAPVVVAKGMDQVALEIKRLAREFNVPIFEQPSLARKLFRDVPVGKAIPERLYRAVANALAFVYRLREQRKGGA